MHFDVCEFPSKDLHLATLITIMHHLGFNLLLCVLASLQNYCCTLIHAAMVPYPDPSVSALYAVIFFKAQVLLHNLKGEICSKCVKEIHDVC